ncbi:MAG: ferredoxin [Patescibacteria group bacterium]|jgi:ferredoxin
MRNKGKISKYLLAGFTITSISFLSGCGNNDNLSDESSDINSDAVVNTDDDNSHLLTNNNFQVEKTEYSNLKITSGCVGCGKCTRIDPEHFSLDETSRRAKVISTDNLDSNNLDTAVQQCPARAIVRS